MIKKKNALKTKDIVVIALTTALTVVIGYVFYFAGSFLPVPGSKFIVFAPFLGFMLYIPVKITGRPGTLTLISVIFGILMSPVTIFMGLAILFTGITSDLVTLVLLHNYKKKWKIYASVALFPAFAILWAFVLTNYFTGNVLYRLAGGVVPCLILFVLIYALAMPGIYLADKVVMNRINKSS